MVAIYVVVLRYILGLYGDIGIMEKKIQLLKWVGVKLKSVRMENLYPVRNNNKAEIE